MPLIEYGFTHDGVEVAEKTCEFYLKSLRNANIDTLILGCTHYPLLKKQITKTMGNNVKIIDVGVAFQSRKYKNKTEKIPPIEFYVSNEPETFALEMKKFLNAGALKKEPVINLIHIEEY